VRAVDRFSGIIIPVVLALFILIPYGFAAAAGTAKEGLTGLAALHSAAESVYCAKGLTPVGIIVMIETGLLFIAVLLASRLDAIGAALRENGWYLLAVMALVALPFIIGWRTESSVCVRGKAFFWEAIFVDVFTVAILAISYNLMFGFAGVVSFGHAAFFGTGAYGVGLLMHHLGWPWWLGIMATLFAGALIALVKGVVGLRIRGLYFALFTLAFAQVFYLLAGNRLMANITGAEDGFTFDVPDWLNITKNRLFLYYLALLALVLAFWLVRRLMGSPTGRVLSALRDNEARAQMLGYNTFYFKLIAIVLAGVMATGAGVMRGLALKGASPEVLSLTYTFDPLLMTLVGGQATFAGPIVGAFGLHLVEDFVRDAAVTVGGVQINIGERWALILGVIFIVIVLAFPYGIVGTWQIKRLNTHEGWRRLFGKKLGIPPG